MEGERYAIFSRGLEHDGVRYHVVLRVSSDRLHEAIVRTFGEFLRGAKETKLEFEAEGVVREAGATDWQFLEASEEDSREDGE